MAAVDDEVMAPGFSADRFIDGGIEKIVGFRGAQRLAQVGGVFLAEAHIELPVQVTRTRLQDSQKLCVSGVMKPSRPPVSATRT